MTCEEVVIAVVEGRVVDESGSTVDLEDVELRDVEEDVDAEDDEDDDDVEVDTLVVAAEDIEDSDEEEDSGSDDVLDETDGVVFEVPLLAEPAAGIAVTVLLDVDVVEAPGVDDSANDVSVDVWLEVKLTGVDVDEISAAGAVAFDVTLDAGAGVTVGGSDDWEEISAGAVVFVEVVFDAGVVKGSDD